MNGVDIAIHKFKDHPSIKMINEKVRFESSFGFKEVSNLDIEREISHLNTKKVGTLEIFLQKFYKNLLMYVTPHLKIYGIMKY